MVLFSEIATRDFHKNIDEILVSDLMNRRDLLKLSGMGVAVFVRNHSSGGGSSQKRTESNDSFYFVQALRHHWGFNAPNINPDSGETLKKAVVAVNGRDEQPDFVVFTADLTQTTDDRIYGATAWLNFVTSSANSR